jgi:hypothetical protein
MKRLLIRLRIHALAWAILPLLLLGFAMAETDQTTAPVGKFFDPDNLEAANKAQTAAQSTREAMQAKKLYEAGKYKDMLQNAFLKYQNSKVGLMATLRKVQQKTSAVLSKAQQRVDKWRTTVPKLRSYTRQTLRFADDSYDFAKTFEMSDLWDIDRDFSREMQWRIKHGRRLGLSIWDFLVARIERKDFLKGIEDILFPDYVQELNRHALKGFVYVDEPSESETVPILALQESLDVLAAVQQMAEAELSPSKEAPALSQAQYLDHRLRQALFDPKSGYTDQAAVRQDIFNRQYEIATKRSLLRDRSARLDLLWGKLAAQKLETKERTTKVLADEIGKLSGVKIDPDAWIYSRFGLEDRKP